MKNQNKGNFGKYWLNTTGYWKNKKRDANTIAKLNESKFIKIAQYNADGDLVKVWDSIKDVAIKIFKDYKIINGGSKSQIYSLLRNKLIDNKFKHNSYWFRVSDLKNDFGELPQKINIDEIRTNQKIKKANITRKVVNKKTHMKKYSVLHYDLDGKLIAKYNSTKHAAYELKTSQKIVERICGGKTKNPVYNLKYGEKTPQPINEKFPSYEVVRQRKEKKYVKTKTRYSVIQLDEDGNKMCVYADVKEAANKLNIKESMVRTLCLNKKDSYILNGKIISLKYGNKIQTTYGR